MSALRRMLARAGTLLLALHALNALCALRVAAPISDAWTTALPQATASAPLGPDDVTRAFAALLQNVQPLGRAAWPFLLAFAVLGPASTIALAHVLSRAAEPVATLRLAVRRCLPALLARALSLTAFGLGALTLGALLSYGLRLTPEALELPVRTAFVALLALHALACATFHDLALVDLATGSSALVDALRRSLRRLGPKVMALRGTAALATLLLTVLADLCARIAWPLPGVAARALSTLLVQLLLFAGLAARALFLQRAALEPLEPVSPPPP